nr:hypothetical protein [Tanacetum cinerariifolium]
MLNMMPDKLSSIDVERHLALYNALINSIALDDTQARNKPSQEANLNKRPHDDQDPPENRKGEKKQKHAGESSSAIKKVTTVLE